MGKKKSIFNTYNRTTKKWDIKRGGEKTTISSHETKTEAAKEGIRQAKKDKTEYVEKNKDGKIGRKNSYGNDPCPPKDKNR